MIIEVRGWKTIDEVDSVMARKRPEFEWERRLMKSVLAVLTIWRSRRSASATRWGV